MNSRRILVLIVACSISDRCFSQDLSVRVRAEFLLRGCEASRLRIRNGDCEILGHKSLQNKEANVKIESQPVRYRVAFDYSNDNVRYEFREPFISSVQLGTPGDAVISKPQVVYREVVFSRSRDASTIYQTGDGLADSVCSVFFPDERICPPGYKCFDPRCISLCEIRKFWGGRTLNEAIDSAMAHINEVTAVESRGNKISRITFRYASSRTELDIDEAKDFSPIRFAVIRNIQKAEDATRNPSGTQSENDFEISAVTSEWAHIHGEWMPVKLETSFRTPDLNYDERMELGMEWRSVNTALDPDLFSYRSFGLRDGVIVVDDRMPKSDTGSAHIIETIGSPRPTESGNSPKSEWRLFLWINLFAAALLLTFIVRRSLWSKRSEKSA